MHSDGRRSFAVGCSAGGLGFRADPDPYERCAERVTRGLAIALQADHLEVVRTDVDFDVPLRAAHYPWAHRLDDGAQLRTLATAEPRAFDEAFALVTDLNARDRLRETLEACAHDDDAAEDALQAAIRGTRGGSPGLDEPNSLRARAASFDSADESDDASFASLTSLGGYSSISLDAPPSLHGSSVAGDDAEFIDDPPRVMPRGAVVPLGRRCAITQIVRNEGLALHPNDGFTLVEQTALDEFNERLAGAAFDIASAQTDGGADDASAASLGSAVSSHASTLFSLNASMSARRAVLAHEAKAIAPSARVLEAGRRFKDVERDARKDIRTAPRPKEFEDEDDLDEEALAERREQLKEATRIGKQTPQPRGSSSCWPNRLMKGGFVDLSRPKGRLSFQTGAS